MAEVKRNLLLKKDFEKIRDRMRIYYLYGYSAISEYYDSAPMSKYWLLQNFEKR